MFHKPAHKDNVNKPGQVRNEHPDAYCYTTPDGDCISTDARCMHQPWNGPKVDTVDELCGLSWACNEDILREMHHKGVRFKGSLWWL
jgi:hypothetical protein